MHLASVPLVCQTGTMDLTTYVSNLGHEFATLAETGGEEARALVERLTGSLESAIRITLLDALSAAATRSPANWHRARSSSGAGRDPNFVVTPTPSERSTDAGDAEAEDLASDGSLGVAEDGPAARINVRLPEQLKARVEEAAAREGRRSTPGSSGQRPPRCSGRIAISAPSRVTPANGQNRASPAGSANPAKHVTNPPRGDNHAYFYHARPISVTLELGIANVRIAASERLDTVVEVRPSDGADESDVKAAEQVRVDYSGGALQIAGPKARSFQTSPARPGRSTSPDRTACRFSAFRAVADGRLPQCRAAR